MKAILILEEMPKDCDKCPCISEEWECRPLHRDAGWGDVRPDYCPLRPLPKKKEEIGKTIQDISYVVGWNACLDEITGEKE